MNESSTGSTTSKRVRLSLTIAVERVDFDSNSCLLRLSGRNSEENPHVKVCVRAGFAAGASISMLTSHNSSCCSKLLRLVRMPTRGRHVGTQLPRLPYYIYTYAYQRSRRSRVWVVGFEPIKHGLLHFVDYRTWFTFYVTFEPKPCVHFPHTNASVCGILGWKKRSSVMHTLANLWMFTQQ